MKRLLLSYGVTLVLAEEESSCEANDEGNCVAEPVAKGTNLKTSNSFHNKRKTFHDILFHFLMSSFFF